MKLKFYMFCNISYMYLEMIHIQKQISEVNLNDQKHSNIQAGNLSL